MKKILSSPVFWQLFLVGLSLGLTVAFPDVIYVKAFATMITFWFGGSVSVNTINKFSEKKVEIAKIEAGASFSVASEGSK